MDQLKVEGTIQLCIISVAWMITFQNIVSEDGRLLAIYGDSVYAFRRYLITPFKGAHLTALQTEFNKKMSALRICVEWGFGSVTNMFAFLAFHRNQKVFLQPLAKYWIVGVPFVQLSLLSLWFTNSYVLWNSGPFTRRISLLNL